MAQVTCDVSFDEIQNDEGRMVPGCSVECSQCGAVEESYGTSARSVRRCLVLLRENCDEKNFYVTKGGEDKD